MPNFAARIADLLHEIVQLLERYHVGMRPVLPPPINDEDLYYLKYGSELRELDYKAELFGVSKESDRTAVACLAKDIIAMSNSGGGRIIVGVADVANGEFVYRGVQVDLLPLYEVTKLNERLKKFIAPITVATRVVSDSDRKYVVIQVRGLPDTIAFARCAHEGAALFEGRIYVRNMDARTSELRDSLEASRLVRRLR